MIIVPILAFASIAAAGGIVSIYDGLTMALASGSWNCAGAGRSNGAHSFAAADADAAGNMSAASRPLNRTVIPSITSFSAVPNTQFYIGGDAYKVETAGESWSLSSPDDHTLRFEIRPGDHAWFDGSNVDRAEIAQQTFIPAGTPVAIDYQFMLEPGAANTARWFVTAEMHNDDPALGPNMHTSPPFAIQLAGDHLQVVARYCPPGGNPSNSSSDLKMMTLWTDPNPIQTRQHSNIQIQANVSNTSAGYLEVWVNGAEVVNYHGPLGYGYPTYWQEGLYRNSGPTATVIADFRNLALTIGSTPP